MSHDHTSVIEIQTLLKLKVGERTHEALDKLLTEPVSPLWIQPSIDQLFSHAEAEHFRNTTSGETSRNSSGQGLKNF
jgi:hypothetical protein